MDISDVSDRTLQDTYKNLELIQNLINDIILNYDLHVKQFEEYRNFCKQINRYRILNFKSIF